MAKRIDKIIQSKTAPENNNVLWDDGENLKINRNGNWENTGNPIDPVVWKYICKPYIFNGLDYSNGSKIPSELLENGKLKYKIPAMYRIQVDNNYYNPDSGEQVDFTDINNLYGEYTPESVDSNSLQTTSLFGEYLVLIYIPLNDEGRWTIEVTV